MHFLKYKPIDFFTHHESFKKKVYRDIKTLTLSNRKVKKIKY